MAQQYAAAGIEPPLQELLEDPITLLVMRRDGIGVADVRRAVAAGLSRFDSAQGGTEVLGGTEPGPSYPPTSEQTVPPGEGSRGTCPGHSSGPRRTLPAARI